MILAADIGGSTLRFGLFETSLGKPVLIRSETFTLERLNTFPEFAREWFGAPLATLQAISIGVAGPVVRNRAQLTNHPYVLDCSLLGKALGCPHVFLINDLQAHAYSISDILPEKMVCLQQGSSTEGNRALIAAGAGLGECTIVPHARRYLALASEAGHADFSPNSLEELELLRFLFQRYEHVSWERVISGKFGFKNLYDFLIDRGAEPPSEPYRSALQAEEEIGRPIQQAAEQGVPIAREVMRLFVRLYGAEAGNLALRVMAVGGIYIGGGIAHKALAWLKSGEFLAAFRAKGRFSALLDSIPVYVLLEERSALMGAARFALDEIGEISLRYQ